MIAYVTLSFSPPSLLRPPSAVPFGLELRPLPLSLLLSGRASLYMQTPLLRHHSNFDVNILRSAIFLLLCWSLDPLHCRFIFRELHPSLFRGLRPNFLGWAAFSSSRSLAWLAAGLCLPDPGRCPFWVAFSFEFGGFWVRNRLRFPPWAPLSPLFLTPCAETSLQGRSLTSSDPDQRFRCNPGTLKRSAGCPKPGFNNRCR